MQVIKIYIKAGFIVTRITADREFKPVVDGIDGIIPNYASALEHVPQAERNNRTIQERVRATFYSLPFQAIPGFMIKLLVSEAARKLNYFPPKGGVSEYYSPREILHRAKLDFSKHCAYAQFSFVQAHDGPFPLNSQKARTLDCIYLRPTDNAQTGHCLLNLATKAEITRIKVTAVPMPLSVISTVETWAKAEGFASLKLTTKTGHILFDSSWIAGVHYTNTNNTNNNNNNNSNNTNSYGINDDDVYNDPDYAYETDEDSRYDSSDYISEDEDNPTRLLTTLRSV